MKSVRMLGLEAVRGWVRFGIDSKARKVRPVDFSAPISQAQVWDTEDERSWFLVERAFREMRAEGLDPEPVRRVLIEAHQHGKVGEPFPVAVARGPVGHGLTLREVRELAAVHGDKRMSEIVDEKQRASEVVEKAAEIEEQLNRDKRRAIRTAEAAMGVKPGTLVKAAVGLFYERVGGYVVAATPVEKPKRVYAPSIWVAFPPLKWGWVADGSTVSEETRLRAELGELNRQAWGE